jgi:hypothetical protein
MQQRQSSQKDDYRDRGNKRRKPPVAERVVHLRPRHDQSSERMILLRYSIILASGRGKRSQHCGTFNAIHAHPDVEIHFLYECIFGGAIPAVRAIGATTLSAH